MCSLGIKQMEQSWVCLIPEELALAQRTRDHVHSTFYITSFFEHVLFQVEDAIKFELLLPIVFLHISNKILDNFHL